jgi:xylanolytic transcriptional activator XlnR
MLSNPLHRFSQYHTLPSTTLLSNGHVQSSHLHATGLDTLAQGSHYALQHLQQHVGVHNPHLARPGPQPKLRQHPYGPAARVTGAAGPIRRRISRACDQCNQLRTKCDGQHPCAHCIGKSLPMSTPLNFPSYHRVLSPCGQGKDVGS